MGQSLLKVHLTTVGFRLLWDLECILKMSSMMVRINFDYITFQILFCIFAHNYMHIEHLGLLRVFLFFQMVTNPLETSPILWLWRVKYYFWVSVSLFSSITGFLTGFPFSVSGSNRYIWRVRTTAWTFCSVQGSSLLLFQVFLVFCDCCLFIYLPSWFINSVHQVWC